VFFLRERFELLRDGFGKDFRLDALAEVLGSDKLTERVKRREVTITAVDAGLLRRELFVCQSQDIDSMLSRRRS
jgi:hypothetical protein